MKRRESLKGVSPLALRAQSNRLTSRHGHALERAIQHQPGVEQRPALRGGLAKQVLGHGVRLSLGLGFDLPHCLGQEIAHGSANLVVRLINALLIKVAPDLAEDILLARLL